MLLLGFVNFFFLRESHVSQLGLKLTTKLKTTELLIFLPLLPVCWDYKSKPPCLIY